MPPDTAARWTESAEIAVYVRGRERDRARGRSDFGKPHLPSFKQDIIPILTKTGCNAGGCHGKLAGQNGFRLSLRGYAPEWDHDWLTKEVSARRIDLAFPERSLLVQKPTGGVPHEGGMRFSEGSRYHKTLVDWIAARAPGPVAGRAGCRAAGSPARRSRDAARRVAATARPRALRRWPRARRDLARAVFLQRRSDGRA